MRPGRRHFGGGHGGPGGAEVVRAGAGVAGKSVQKALFLTVPERKVNDEHKVRGVTVARIKELAGN